MWIFGIIVIVLLLIMAVCLSVIRFELWIKKHGKDDEVVLNIRMLYGLIRLHYELPIMKFENMKKGILIKVEKKNNIKESKDETKKTRVDKRKIDYWQTQFIKILEATDSFLIWMKKTLSHVSILKLDWSTNISAGDAAYTAIATGMVWSIKGSLVGWLSYHMGMRTAPRLFVVPVFDDKPQFSTELSCIAQISCGYAMYAGLILMVRVFKVKGGIKKWKSILFKV
ncbi:hypothetical protein J2T13_004904 [Paenibacillus sp. DS2015]|uniref:DUF2953 domain-containing protein n=1 Tax=Paenibacillus sp. DS2015 TaxID=3373917 RepID=UPI003D205ABE